MPLEDLTGPSKYIDSLDPVNPVGGTDTLDDADAHMRGIKNTIKNTFANITAVVTATAAELNLLTGLTNLNFLRNDIAATKDGNLTLNDALIFQKSWTETAISLGVSGTLDIDFSAGSYQYTGVLTGSPTFTFSNPPASGRVASVVVELNNALNFPPTWPVALEWPEGVEPSWTAGKDIVMIQTRDGGTVYTGFLGGKSFS